MRDKYNLNTLPRGLDDTGEYDEPTTTPASATPNIPGMGLEQATLEAVRALSVWSELAEFPGAIDGSTFDEFISADDVAIMGQLQDEDYVADVMPTTSISDSNEGN
ncbi:hypothetical protein HPB50_005769 [Hyalomma asiaticum]|uniref:Uncharacterized protein n=1 Tax=Hyalomma asiaticum TaxID=266040 RepID=A0ACB7SCU4_HYAAI|nr:hypothetical protein HPB50_005769 [Hyalomma asiaticum]